ncbi:hypothetical protein GOP47_0023976 [Adiantum capillus-veneris]|uniref:PRONE domain-containing protein n=1 Tax=Adiantum capillus-veneris TaxID=13818 RepID=A0A9D4U725_ADICA|nr:hypothetical protein GOP47_0023976 [Adiantum capillus-veneris]
MSRFEKSVFDSGSDELGERHSADGTSSSGSFDRFCADILGDSVSMGSPRDPFWDDESIGTSVESSPVGWTRPPRDKSRLGKLHSLPKVINSTKTSRWEERESLPMEDFAEDMSEVDMMKERFARLLLGEDLSGGGKGVCSALAISNAVTNFSASVFGELWRVGPLAQERKARWQREMSWLLSVSDHIVEFVPSSQILPNGSITEVMVTKQRSDLHINLPALRKLDNMLIEALDSFNDTEFWYADHANTVHDSEDNPQQKQGEKWWLPTPKVPAAGLSADARKQLQLQRENINQVLKAALAINAQVLSEMEVPSLYWDALPKNGRSSLGEALYRTITAERFSPDALISSIDASHERNVLEMVNRVEAATQTWRRKLQTRQSQVNAKDGRSSSKSSWGIPKDGAADLEKREGLVDKAETLLLLLKQKFPGLPQTILDMNKIQYNKDVGQSILESYSRVLESLAFNILSRIDDVLHADDLAKMQPLLTTNVPTNQNGLGSLQDFRGRINLAKSASISGPGAVVSLRTLHSKKLSDHIGWSAEDGKPRLDHYTASPPSLRSLHSKKLLEQKNWSPGAATPEMKAEFEHYTDLPLRRGPMKNWSFSGAINGMRSPPSRD